MKNFLLFVLICSFLVYFNREASAIVRTVSNEAGAKAQYTQVHAAIGASSAGDVILVHPSSTPYEDFNIDRAVKIVGAGYNPDFGGKLCKVSIVRIINGSDGATLEGFYIVDLNSNFYHSWYGWQNHTPGNITIRNNYIEYFDTYGSGWNIYNNIIKNTVNIHNSSNHTFQNNLFLSNTPSIYTSNQSSVTIRNNIFTGCTACSTFVDVSNATINNNIFYGKNPRGASTSGFNNNIVYNTSDNTLPYGDNIGENNKVNLDPKFVNVPSKDNFTYSYDYDLQSNSPGINAGTDSTDIGTYGGSYPWLEHLDGKPDYTGQPYLPFIKSFSLINNVVPKNGFLKFNVKAVKKD